MTGVTYNAIPPMNYGGKAHGMPPHLYGHQRPHLDSFPSSIMTMKPQDHLAPLKEVPATEPVQKKPTATTAGSQPRIPSSINNTKGSLAEFAAQVSVYMDYLVRCAWN